MVNRWSSVLRWSLALVTNPVIMVASLVILPFAVPALEVTSSWTVDFVRVITGTILAEVAYLVGINTLNAISTPNFKIIRKVDC